MTMYEPMTKLEQNAAKRLQARFPSLNLKLSGLAKQMSGKPYPLISETIGGYVIAIRAPSIDATFPLIVREDGELEVTTEDNAKGKKRRIPAEFDFLQEEIDSAIQIVWNMVV